MAIITPNSLINTTERTIKNWNCSFIAVEGPNIINKLSLEDLAIPYESQYRSRIVLKAGESNKLLYGFVGKAVTFLMIKVTYDSLKDPYYIYEQIKYNINYYFENDPILRPLNRLLIMTGSSEERIPQIYVTNPLDYDVVLDILHATVDSEFDDETDVPSDYQIHYGVKNISSTYTGTTTDEYIRCSGTTDNSSTYSLYLPISTGSGNVLTIKNISEGVITIIPESIQTIDYSTSYEYIHQYEVLRLIDASVGNWDKI